MSTTLPTIVLCAPGPWSSVDELSAALGAAGLTLTDGALARGGETLAEVEFEGAEPRMGEAFRAAGFGDASTFDAGDAALMDAIERHRSVAYLVSPPVARGEAARAAHAMLQAGVALLDAGAPAIKCESSGLAHGPQAWRRFEAEATANLALLASGSPQARWSFWDALREAYVCQPIADERDVYSCGMHLLGARDLVASAGSREAADFQRLAGMVSLLLLSDPDWAGTADGDTFEVEEGRRVRFRAEPCDRYEPDDLFHNPFGYWRLTP